MLNGGTQHVFQSSLRTSVKLNVLSPAIFPLPFGAKLATPANRVINTNAESSTPHAVAVPEDIASKTQKSKGIRAGGQLKTEPSQAATNHEAPDASDKVQAASEKAPVARDKAHVASGEMQMVNDKAQEMSSLKGKRSSEVQRLLLAGPVTRLRMTKQAGFVAVKEHEGEGAEKPQSPGMVHAHKENILLKGFSFQHHQVLINHLSQ